MSSPSDKSVPGDETRRKHLYVVEIEFIAAWLPQLAFGPMPGGMTPMASSMPGASGVYDRIMRRASTNWDFGPSVAGCSCTFVQLIDGVGKSLVRPGKVSQEEDLTCEKYRPGP